MNSTALSLSSPRAIAEVQVWRADLDGLAVADFEPLLSADERARAGRYHAAPHRDRFIVARGLLRKLLSGHLNLAPEEITFAYHEHGKPYLIDNPVYFSVSHSASMLLIAMAPYEVGVDIELIRDSVETLDIARKYFGSSETRALEAMTTAERIIEFFKLWTKKEALLKARGIGIAHGLESCDFSAIDWMVCPIDAPAGYAAALALNHSHFKVQYMAEVLRS